MKPSKTCKSLYSSTVTTLQRDTDRDVSIDRDVRLVIGKIALIPYYKKRKYFFECIANLI